MNTTKQASDTIFRRPAGGGYVVIVPRHRDAGIGSNCKRQGSDFDAEKSLEPATPFDLRFEPRLSPTGSSLRFLAELLLFALIAGISAWAIFALADAMSQNLR